MITFTVWGRPQPQGSSRAFIPKGWTRAVITSANSKNKPWRQEIAGTALAEMEKERLSLAPKGKAIAIEANFIFTKPKSTKKSEVYKVTKPDTDKLVRSLLDALTGIVFADDSQVVQIVASKNFGAPEKVIVSVKVLEPADSLPFLK